MVGVSTVSTIMNIVNEIDSNELVTFRDLIMNSMNNGQCCFQKQVNNTKMRRLCSHNKARKIKIIVEFRVHTVNTIWIGMIKINNVLEMRFTY